MKMKRFKYLLVLTACLFFSCGGGGDDEPVTPPEPDIPTEPVVPSEPSNPSNPSDNQLAVNLKFNVADYTFKPDDALGVYMVNQADNTSQPLLTKGNWKDNVKFYYSSERKWVSESPVYWKDRTTHSDFYYYFPYQPVVADVSACPFSVQADQRSQDTFLSGLFLWGKKMGVKPANADQNLKLTNLMSRICVNLQAGEGFSNSELSEGHFTVTLCGLQRVCSVDLANGTVVAAGNGEDIQLYTSASSRKFEAFLPPQKWQDHTSIVVAWEGGSCQVHDGGRMFESGKKYDINVTVSRKQNGLEIGMGSWQETEEDYGGIVN